MRIGSFLLVLSLLLAFSNAATYCQGTKYISVSSGLIEDPVGGGNYKDLKECVWILTSPTPAKYLTISFNRFDLEYAYDFLKIKNSGNYTAKLSGYEIPRPVSIPTNGLAVTVTFSVDQLISFKGFSFSFVFNDCPNTCLHGYCFQGACTCYNGWNGNTCQTPYCPNNCNGKGTCISNVCVCSAGWTGADCTQQDTVHCNGGTAITGSAGNFSDHTPWYKPYKDNQLCSWQIRTGTPGPVTIVTALHQFEWFTDNLYVYDGDSDSDPLLAVISMSGFPVGPVVTNRDTGNIYVKFSTSAQDAFTGFVALYSRNDQCPNSCSENGYCVEGKCSCMAGKTGTDCSQDQVAIPIRYNETITGQLNDFEWRYYRIYVPESVSVPVLNVAFSRLDDMPENSYSAHWKWGGGDLTFLAGYEYLPNLVTYETAVPYWIFPSVLRIYNPRAGIYNIGIYAKEAAGFTLRVEPLGEDVTYVEPTFPASTANSATQGMVTSGTPKSSVGLVIGIVVIVLSLVMIAVIAGGYFYYKRRGSSPLGFTRVDQQGEAQQLDLE